MPAELPPESKANDPLEEKTTEVAGVGKVMGGCKACSVEYTYREFPPLPRINAFNPSGENAAAVALLMFKATVPADDVLVEDDEDDDDDDEVDVTTLVTYS